MRGWAIGACLLALGLNGTAHAEPLNLKHIAAKAKWLVHVDVDAMRSSVVVAKGYEQWQDKGKAIAEQIAEIKTACQVFDPTKDLQGVTFYGNEFSDDAGVAIIYAHFTDSVLRTLYEEVQKLPNYASQWHGEFELHSWIHAKGKRHQRKMTAAYVKPNIMIFGGSVREVSAALDVLDGTKPNLAGTSSPLAGPTPAGTLLLARVIGLSTVGLPIESPIIKQTEMLGLTMGENNNEAYLTSELAATNAQIAEQVRAAVDNALTAALLATDDADLADLINAAQVVRDGKTVTVDVRGPAEVGWKYLEKLVASIVQASNSHLDGKKWE